MDDCGCCMAEKQTLARCTHRSLCAGGARIGREIRPYGSCGSSIDRQDHTGHPPRFIAGEEAYSSGDLCTKKQYQRNLW